ncbi:hypothetical protein AAG906_028488 [Vitis piasezkii]
MNVPSNSVNTAPKSRFPCSLFIVFLLILSHAYIIAADYKPTNIGAIVDASSRKGKEEKTAMEIAISRYNRDSKNLQLFLHFGNSTGEPIQAAFTAQELIKEKEVGVIVGTDTWQEAALVADVGNRAQVPVLSLAASTITPPLRQIRWPFLALMGSNVSEQIRCISAIVGSYHWQRVIVVYEDDAHGGDSGMLAPLSEALQYFSSEIEYTVVLPPISSLSDPKEAINEELMKLLSIQSRVFIVLKSSPLMATHLFQEARRMGFMARESAWIITDTISSFLDSIDISAISYMEGALGIKTYYSKTSRPFLEFSAQFQKMFENEYPEEDNTKPGIHALRAYDSISVIANALVRLASDTNTPKRLLETILSSNFNGLSGKISFQGGDLLDSNSLPLRIINLVGKGYKELDFWTQDLDHPFSREGGEANSSRRTTKVLDGPVIWPGYLKRVPKGWEMPTDEKRLKIGIPANSSFDKFVKVDETQIDPEKNILVSQDYSLPYDFHPFDGTYDELVDRVYTKTYDAVVGDMTILANRSRIVEFTQPFAESGLCMITPVKSREAYKAWLFMKPFTMEMWVVTGVILIYTMFIVWILEHQNNPEFQGSWKDQLGTTLWFTFSTLFFAHKEKINSNITRVVVVVWLMVVFVLTSSYTASLSSMLTVQRLEPNVTDIEWLKVHKLNVGCDGDSFVRKYLEDVLDFKRQHQEYYSLFELPYEKVFMNRYCKNYTASNPPSRFGGLGFVFQKGSPIAADVSKAILTLSERGILQSLEDKCLQNFWALYVLCGATSTICFLLFLCPPSESAWRRTVELANYIHNVEIKIPDRASDFLKGPIC